MLHQYKIKGTPEVYTIAVNSCSQTGDWEFACSVYSDMTRNGVIPDEVFRSTPEGQLFDNKKCFAKEKEKQWDRKSIIKWWNINKRLLSLSLSQCGRTFP